MNDTRPALLVANQDSRKGEAVAPFEAALREGGIDVRREPCADPGKLAALIRERAGSVSCVLLGGGDGTMHAAAPALRDTGLPLGILPLGTANDLARSLGIPPEPREAAAIVVGGHRRAIDLGTANGVPFFNVASLGLSVAVTKRLNGAVKRRLGMLAYPLVACRTLLTARRFSATLRADGTETQVKTLQIAVGNGRFYGGGSVVDRDADIADGILNVYSLEPRARWRLVLMAHAFRSGEHRSLPEVRSFTCRTLSVATRRPQEINADGEIVTKTPVEFGILPKAVHVFVPAPAR